MGRPWMIDELAYAGSEHLGPEFVAGYDRKAGYGESTRGGAPGGERSPEGTGRTDGTDPSDDVSVLRANGLTGTSTLVDLGCGTGRFALAAAPHVRHVVAVDISPAMLMVVRDQARAAELSNLDCVQAGFLSYQHDGPPADAVYTRNALHQLPDFWKALALDRIAGVLRPGGLLRIRDLIFDFTPSTADAVIDDWIAGASDDPSRGYTRDDFVEHLRSEFSTFRWLFEPMLAAAGFKILTADFRRSVYGAYTCVRL